ncbi:alpha-1,2-fucosyltransferase [Rhabdaerophilum calidifontis]|uniref:alpha-1,2-fucosyltransferase n=1 Tax=Rhabdaerophilum calidifontis TaxID=2604328 RepID=UPI00140AAD21|nr:alpha-1,2-fucosyltransferase [Rhabdaerophilum calidifontis]
MFQAAAGLALHLRQGGRLVFDLSRFRAGAARGYALAPFALPAEIRPAERGLVAALRRQVAKRRAPGRPPVPRWWRGPVHVERGFGHDPAIAALAGDALIAGYFQSPRYFEDRAEAIAALLDPARLAGPGAAGRAVRLEGETSVAVHVRRGDYASGTAGAVHPVLPEAYYIAAAQAVRARVAGARFFVFSDDAAAAAVLAARLGDAEPMAGADAGEDLYLMSRARHHVIANSSFSWWSAWLDRRPGGMRIAPRLWFTPAAAATRPTDDLFPADWMRL